MIAWAITFLAAALLILAIFFGSSSIVPDIWTALFFILLAAVASIIASVVGLGGGLVIVPVLVVLGLSPSVAAFSSLAATMSNATASSLIYAKQKRIEYWEALKLGLLAIPGSILGAVLSKDADPSIYGLLLAPILISAAVYVYIRPYLRTQPHPGTSVLLALSAATSFFAGVVSSYFGIGGGVVFVPLLVLLSGMSIMRAAPTSILALLFTSIAGIATHGILGDTDAILALLLSGGGLIGGMVGAKISLSVGEKYLRALVVITMVVAGISPIWNTLTSDNNT